MVLFVVHLILVGGVGLLVPLQLLLGGIDRAFVGGDLGFILADRLILRVHVLLVLGHGGIVLQDFHRTRPVLLIPLQFRPGIAQAVLFGGELLLVGLELALVGLGLGLGGLDV